MRVRSLLVATALVSSMLGAVIAYLVLTVPNDLKSSELLRTARKQISQRKHEEARKTLTNLVQSYPRTDAAAAGTVALLSLADGERAQLARQLEQLRKDQEKDSRALNTMAGQLTEVAKRPVPAEEQVAPEKPPSQITITKSSGKKAPAKSTKKEATTKRRTRRR